MGIIMTKVATYTAMCSMNKVAISNARILGAIEKRYADIERSGNTVIKGMKQHKTFKQLVGMKPPLESRLGSTATKRLLDDAPYDHAVRYNDSIFKSIKHKTRGGSTGYYPASTGR